MVFERRGEDVSRAEKELAADAIAQHTRLGRLDISHHDRLAQLPHEEDGRQDDAQHHALREVMGGDDVTVVRS